MMNRNRADAARILVNADRILILTHRRPDGDTSGSAAALCRGLRQLGKQAWVLENPEMTARFQWLHGGLTKPEAEEGDFIVCVDVASAKMLPEAFLPLLDRMELRVDHHGSAVSFANQELVDPGSASCAEIVWDILQELGVQPDADIATAVYVGLATDTGCFRYSNTTAHTFATAAACAQTGMNVYGINQDLFETNTLSRLKMQAWMVEHLKMLPGGLAICAIPLEVEKALEVTEDDMDNISSFPRSIEGVKMAATLRETSDGTKMSVRAVPGMDAARVTASFGGGGHKGAAGARVNLPLMEAAAAVEKVMLEQTAE